MAFNEREFWKYLYYNDNGTFHSMNEFLKKQEVDDKIIGERLSYFASINNIDLNPEYNNGHHENPIDNLRRGGNTLDNTPINARITADGRWYYVRAYLAQDFADDQKEMATSVIATNNSVQTLNDKTGDIYVFQKWTTRLTIIVAMCAVGVTAYDVLKKPATQIDTQTIEQELKLIRISIDSLQVRQVNVSFQDSPPTKHPLEIVTK